MSGSKQTMGKQTQQPATMDLSLWLRLGCYLLLGLVLAWSMFQPMDSTSVFDGSAMLQNLVWLLLAVLVSLEAIVSQHQLRLSKLEGVVLSLVGVWMLVVTLLAGGSFNPRTGWNGFWHVVGAMALYYSIRAMVRTTLERAAILCIILAGAITLSGVGVYQVTVAFPEMRQQFFSDPERQLLQMGIEAPEGSPTRKRLEDRLNSPEPYATFSLANSLAVLLSGALVGAVGSIAYGLFLRWRKAANSKLESNDLIQASWLHLVLLSGGCLLIGAVWFLTRSRVALAAVPLTLGLMLLAALWQWRDQLRQSLSSEVKRKLGLGIGVLACLLLLGFFLIWRRDPQVFTEATKSLSYRFEYWQATLKIIQQFPLFGIGLGNFQAIYPQYMSPTASETIADPHNWILDLASCCSVPIALLMVASLIWTVVQKPVASQVLSNTKSHHRSLALGAAGGSFLVLLGLYVFGQEAGLLAALMIFTTIAMLVSLKLFPLVAQFVSNSNLVFKAMLVAMLLCLLISGSWQASGILCPLLACWALSRPIVGDDVELSKASTTEPAWIARLVMVVWLAVAGCFVMLSWKPVLASQTEAAQTFTSPRQQLEAIERAGLLDPQNAEWDRYRAKLLVDIAVGPGDGERFRAAADQAVAAIESWTAREPMSFLTWQFAGDRCLELAAASERKKIEGQTFLELAEQFYSRAVERRPNSVQLHLQFAYCLALRGKRELSWAELDRAEALSNASPHVDQRIQSQLLWVPTGPADLSPQNSDKPYCKAELVVDWIRNQSKP